MKQRVRFVKASGDAQSWIGQEGWIYPGPKQEDARTTGGAWVTFDLNHMELYCSLDQLQVLDTPQVLAPDV